MIVVRLRRYCMGGKRFWTYEQWVVNMLPANYQTETSIRDRLFQHKALHKHHLLPWVPNTERTGGRKCCRRYHCRHPSNDAGSSQCMRNARLLPSETASMVHCSLYRGTTPWCGCTRRFPKDPLDKIPIWPGFFMSMFLASIVMAL